jgi:hypothetical protein
MSGDRVCEAIIRHLEAREGHPRVDVSLRDQGTDIAGVDARVEMTFRIGGRLYALEHTGIEPFDGYVEMNNEAGRLFEPLRQSLMGLLDPGSAFELTIQLHALRGRRTNDVKRRHDALQQWVLDNVPTIPRRPYRDLRCGQADGTVMGHARDTAALGQHRLSRIFHDPAFRAENRRIASCTHCAGLRQEAAQT